MTRLDSGGQRRRKKSYPNQEMKKKKCGGWGEPLGRKNPNRKRGFVLKHGRRNS